MAQDSIFAARYGPGPSGSNNRLFINGRLWAWRSGAHWRDLLERHGNGRRCITLQPLCHAGIWERVFEALTADRDNQYLMIDSTIGRTHEQAASGKGGKDQALRVSEAD